MTSFTSKALLSKLRRPKKKNGFTFVEMMAVVAITGILSAVSLPAFTTETNKAKDSATIATLTSAAKECGLSLVSRGNNSNYLDKATNKPFEARFVNVVGICELGGTLSLVSPGRAEDATNDTHIAEIIFVNDVPQIAEFRTQNPSRS